MVISSLQYLKAKILALIASAMLSLSISAAPLEWSVTNSIELAHPGDTVFFSGSITNKTGSTLESTDFFLDFLAFDSSNLIPNQELGLVPFTLLDLENSGNVTLFNVDINPFALPDTYHLLVMLQDTNGNLTEAIDVAIIISEIPEPSAANLLLLGLITLLLISSYRSFKFNTSNIDKKGGVW